MPCLEPVITMALGEVVSAVRSRGSNAARPFSGPRTLVSKVLFWARKKS